MAKGPHIVTENREYLTPLEGGVGGSRMDRGGREGTQDEQRQVRRGEAGTNRKKQVGSEDWKTFVSPMVRCWRFVDPWGCFCSAAKLFFLPPAPIEANAWE